MRKILYSPGYGAGWSSWSSGEAAKYMLTYQPIIEFIENGGKFEYDDCHGEKLNHPLLIQLAKDCKEKFDKDYVCLLGACDLQVAHVNERVRIDEYDGSESYIEEGQDEGWM